MKELGILNYLLVCVAIVVMSACQKEDQFITNGEILNQFTLDGKSYELENAYLEDYGELDNVYCLDIYLTSSTIIYSLEEEDILGAGHLIYFDFESTVPHDIAPGRYVFSEEGGPFTFVEGIVSTNYDIQEDEGKALGVASGTVTVAGELDRMKMQFSLLLENGQEVEGFYEGQLINID